MIKFQAIRENWSAGIGLLIGESRGDGVMRSLHTVEWRPVEPGFMVDPVFRLSLEEAQLLVDELWNAGIRPSEGTGSAGSLAATERHLADMRAIAFGALNSDGFKKP